MDAIARGIGGLGRFNAILGRAGVVLGAVLMTAMTLIVLLGVFFRYVLNDSITWVEDVSLIAMVTTAFVVAPLAYRSGANVAIEMLVMALPRALLRLVRLAINLLILWILYRHFGEALDLVQRGWGIRVNTVPVAWAWFYMIVPVAFAAMAAVGIELVLRDAWGLAARSDALDPPHLAPQLPE